MSVYTEGVTGEIDQELGADIRFRVESIAAAMAIPDAAVMFADIAEYFADRAREFTIMLYGSLDSPTA